MTTVSARRESAAWRRWQKTLVKSGLWAPDAQCSAMSQRITVRGDLVVKSVDFPVEGVHAYSVSGTPADCVKVAFSYVLPEKPDVLFSGINAGYNVGLDLAYSGTVGAAMEGLMQGVPAIAFSGEGNGVYDVVDQYLIPITEELLAKKLPANQIWNVNFPGCTCDKLRGIKRDRIPAQTQFYLDHYERKELEEGAFCLVQREFRRHRGSRFRYRGRLE